MSKRELTLPSGTPLEQVGTGDLRVGATHFSGLTFLHLYDADDHDLIIVAEDDIVPLRDRLNDIIRDHQL